MRLLSAVASPCSPPPRRRPRPLARKLEFEVASVRPSSKDLRDAAPVALGLRMDGSQARIGALTLRDYIAMAYRIKSYQVVGADWIATDRFDVNAKLPEGSTVDQIPAMIQSLLAERFAPEVPSRAQGSAGLRAGHRQAAAEAQGEPGRSGRPRADSRREHLGDGQRRGRGRQPRQRVVLHVRRRQVRGEEDCGTRAGRRAGALHRPADSRRDRPERARTTSRSRSHPRTTRRC